MSNLCDEDGASKLSYEEYGAHWKRIIDCAKDASRVQEAERLIADLGIDVADAEYERGCSALHTAASVGNAAMVQLLLAQGARVKGLEPGSREPIHDAVASGSVETVRLLLEAGASLLTKDEDGRIAAHHAAAIGSIPMLEEIFQRGGLRHWGAGIEGDETPLSVAVIAGHEEAAHWLADANADVSQSLLFVCDRSEAQVDQAKLLLGLQADPEHTNEQGWRAAFVAALDGKQELMELLLEHPKTTQDTRDMTLALLVVRHWVAPLGQVAIARGADPRIVAIGQNLPQAALLWEVDKLRRHVQAELFAATIDSAMPDAHGAADSIPPPSKGFTL